MSKATNNETDKERISPAQAGQEFVTNGRTEVVQESCDVNNGFWHCIEHSQGFANNMMKDGHIRTGRHTLVWLCLHHGFEAP